MTEIELEDCEVWLVSAKKICRSGDGDEDKELVPEKLHCNWSNNGKIIFQNLRPGSPYYASLFRITPKLMTSADVDAPVGEPSKAEIALLTTPSTPTLTYGISEPGQYRLKIIVSAAKSVPPASEALIFNYSDYDHVSLIRETDMPVRVSG